MVMDVFSNDHGSPIGDSVTAQELAFLNGAASRLPHEIHAKIQLLLLRTKRKQLVEYGRYLQLKHKLNHCILKPGKLSHAARTDSSSGREQVGLDGAGSSTESEDIIRVKSCLEKDIANVSAKGRKVLSSAMSSFYSPSSALAYLVEQLPMSFASNARIFKELLLRCPDLPPGPMLDFGAGPGTSVLALEHVLQERSREGKYREPSPGHRESSLEHLRPRIGFELDVVHLVERSVNMQQLAEKLLPRRSAQVSDSVPEFSERLSPSENSCRAKSHPHYLMYNSLFLVDEKIKFPVVTASYSLSEVYTDRLLVLRDLWSRVAENGVLVIVEHGTPSGFALINGVREAFISGVVFSNTSETHKETRQLYTQAGHSCDSHTRALNPFHFVAPCPHEKTCPLASSESDWCHFEASVLRGSPKQYTRGAVSKNVDRSKFSYLVIRKCPRPSEKERKAKPLNGAVGTTLMPNAFSATTSSFSWSRLIMPPIRSPRHVYLDVCTKHGKFSRLVVTKSDGDAEFGYSDARQLVSWGDLWPYRERVALEEARSNKGIGAQSNKGNGVEEGSMDDQQAKSGDAEATHKSSRASESNPRSSQGHPSLIKMSGMSKQDFDRIASSDRREGFGK